MRFVATFTLLVRVCRAATREELALTSEELQAGTLDEQGLDIFRQHAKENPGDWRIHAMLGQALAQKKLAGGVEALRTASRLAPHVGQVQLALAEDKTRAVQAAS